MESAVIYAWFSSHGQNEQSIEMVIPRVMFYSCLLFLATINVPSIFAVLYSFGRSSV